MHDRNPRRCNPETQKVLPRWPPLPTHIDAATQPAAAATTGQSSRQSPASSPTVRSMPCWRISPPPSPARPSSSPLPSPRPTDQRTATPDSIQLAPLHPGGNLRPPPGFSPRPTISTPSNSRRTIRPPPAFSSAPNPSRSRPKPSALSPPRSLDSSADLATAHYNLGPREGLVNSAILYPVTRALFGVRPRFPLAIDLGLSAAHGRASRRRRAEVHRHQPERRPPLARRRSRHRQLRHRRSRHRHRARLPQPAASDLNTLLAQIGGSLFAEVDAKAAFWQRARGTQPAHPFTSVRSAHGEPRHRAHARCLPSRLHQPARDLVAGSAAELAARPQTTLHHARPRASTCPTVSGRASSTTSSWPTVCAPSTAATCSARSRRSISPGSPRISFSPAAAHQPEKHIQDLAAAFETDKPYLVSRWRWPDRFNP